MDWSSFLAAGTGRAVRPFLPEALAERGELPPGIAVDLGCGDGTESRFLIASGWRVHAYDGAEGVEDRVAAGLSSSALERLNVTRTEFEDIQTLPENEFMYAGRSLPFCAAAAFPQLWSAIRASITPGGWFVGDFFGPNDSWVGREDMNFQGRPQVEALLDGFEISRLDEAEGPASTPFGSKHMHILSVVARSRPGM